jgi:hypothetical protein
MAENDDFPDDEIPDLDDEDEEEEDAKEEKKTVLPPLQTVDPRMEMARMHNETMEQMEEKMSSVKEINADMASFKTETSQKIDQLMTLIQGMAQGQTQAQRPLSSPMKTPPEVKEEPMEGDTGKVRYSIRVQVYNPRVGRKQLMALPNMSSLMTVPETPDDIEEARQAYGDGRIYFVVRNSDSKVIRTIDCRDFSEYGPPVSPSGTMTAEDEEKEMKRMASRKRQRYFEDDEEEEGEEEEFPDDEDERPFRRRRRPLGRSSDDREFYERQLERQEAKFDKLMEKYDSLLDEVRELRSKAPMAPVNNHQEVPKGKDKIAEIREFITTMKEYNELMGITKPSQANPEPLPPANLTHSLEPSDDDAKQAVNIINAITGGLERVVDKIGEGKIIETLQQGQGQANPSSEQATEEQQIPFITEENRKQIDNVRKFLNFLGKSAKKNVNLTPLIEKIVVSQKGSDLYNYRPILAHYASLGYEKSLSEINWVASQMKVSQNFEEHKELHASLLRAITEAEKQEAYVRDIFEKASLLIEKSQKAPGPKTENLQTLEKAVVKNDSLPPEHPKKEEKRGEVKQEDEEFYSMG